MDAMVRDKVKKILCGELKYTSTNLAFNMMISKMQKKIQTDPAALESCMKEMDEFLAKYPIVAKVDLANIAAL
ncbi:MAG: hypothetical protein K5857_05570 [Lachnospiraceae bacterium]|nr:hypothetical protein [Lachnospiraceae bacterium]